MISDVGTLPNQTWPNGTSPAAGLFFSFLDEVEMVLTFGERGIAKHSGSKE